MSLIFTRNFSNGDRIGNHFHGTPKVELADHDESSFGVLFKKAIGR